MAINPGSQSGDLVVVDSCTTTWAFDPTRCRFARIPRGMALDSVSAEWRPYHSMTLDMNTGQLEVALDPAGTRLLRSDIHSGAPCPGCGANANI